MVNESKDRVGVSKDPNDVAKRILRAAWLGVLLGIGLELALLLLAYWQDQLPAPVKIVADTVQKLSWSSLICAALAAGQAIAKKAMFVGLWGLIAGPAAFAMARSMHKATQHALGLATTGSHVNQWLAAGVKGMEYAILGLAIYALTRRVANWKPYALVGAAVGVGAFMFTTIILKMPGDPLQRAVVEVLHPVGCALAVYVSVNVRTKMGGLLGST